MRPAQRSRADALFRHDQKGETLMKISRHFSLEELVPQEIIKQFGQNAQWFLDPALLNLADFVREFFKVPVTINNWHTGGDLQYRGFRPPSYTGGGTLSQHRFGRAIDLNVQGKTSKEVYDLIILNQDLFMAEGL